MSFSRPYTWLTFSVCLLLLALVSCRGKSAEERTAPVQVLLTEAQGLSRLELATSELRTTLTLDPKKDGLFGWKRLLGSRETTIEIVSQASAYCDLSRLTASMVHQRNDSVLDLVLPPIEVLREMESIHRVVQREADPMRSRLTENEIEEILRKQEAKVTRFLDESLQRIRPQLLLDARRSAEAKLGSMLRELGLTVHVSLSPSDEAESLRNPSYTPTPSS